MEEIICIGIEAGDDDYENSHSEYKKEYQLSNRIGWIS